MIILKVCFLLLAVFFTMVNATRAVWKLSVPPVNFMAQSVGIVGFITVQFLL